MFSLCDSREIVGERGLNACRSIKVIKSLDCFDFLFHFRKSRYSGNSRFRMVKTWTLLDTIGHYWTLLGIIGHILGHSFDSSGGLLLFYLEQSTLK